MNVTFLKALVALVPGWMLLTGSIAQFTRERTKHTLLQVLGAGALVVVIFTHTFEALRFLPWMDWGRQSSAGHSIDVGSAVVAATLFPTGYLLHALTTRRAV